MAISAMTLLSNTRLNARTAGKRSVKRSVLFLNPIIPVIDSCEHHGRRNVARCVRPGSTAEKIKSHLLFHLVPVEILATCYLKRSTRLSWPQCQANTYVLSLYAFVILSRYISL